MVRKFRKLEVMILKIMMRKMSKKMILFRMKRKLKMNPSKMKNRWEVNQMRKKVKWMSLKKMRTVNNIWRQNKKIMESCKKISLSKKIKYKMEYQIK